ncbi:MULTISPECIES: diguanylate cyclase [Marinobacter]|jgi:diguanylate cyclase (GGDEF)-like protein|uniref:diguanylate cyclase n=4 Tax=Pseudomonadota TaxID=1224 RepID=A0A1W6KD05_9GAMM|nr:MULTISPECIES: diguanylate cyclase [Marinobacter]ARM85314.1 response regulator PleD [Marinobacter salarius]AZR40202.1 diguanylate cyclase [Marinobacter salarius]MAB50302.1 GGDEF domain-containing protein [Marinobacter sp.]MBJ7300437.1 diguanylate cyclase [Marinobacter salarius]MBS8229885.1 diguanylate cyclase [Marinobacter salarius]|tara:strand:- start:3973 stop:4971 length:999 start_codon:yes stop_codon:yes gene_type:complete
MTETRLRSFTHLAGYAFASLFIASLAFQNLRYGFYDLFFLAAGMALLTVAGAGYTFICRRRQLSAPGHLLILTALNSGLVAAMFALDPPGISHWVMPLVVLNLLILPLRQGLILSLLLLVALALFLLLSSPLMYAITISAGVFALVAVAALYIWHYDHMAQSAEDLAITDPVTGAHNARFLDETLQKEISRAIVMSHSLSVISLAIDYAEEAEDLHGQAGMQRLLRDLTQHLFDVIRAGDTLYTLEDGEFFLILPFTPEEGVRVIAERIRRTIAEQNWPLAGKVTVSLGCTTRASTDIRTADLRKRVRHALEEARKRGADSVWYSQGDVRPS